MTDFANKFQLHYFLDDGSHKMDAFIRNKCEQELLSIFNEISSHLGIPLVVETEAHAEGGLKEFWSFIGKNSPQISAVILLSTLIMSRIPVTDSELIELQKEEARLTIEEKRLKIDRLKRELDNGGEVAKDTLSETVKELDSHIKILKHKSNFYNQLFYYEKVTAIGTSPLNDNYIPIEDEKVIDRRDFPKFILTADEIKPEIDEEAKIEIISPVLKRGGNYKWKGVYQNEPISFYLKDKNFKNSIVSNGVPFKNGTFIDCILEMDKKINNAGETYISSYSVKTVIRKYDDLGSMETPQGKKYFRNKKANERQMTVLNWP